MRDKLERILADYGDKAKGGILIIQTDEGAKITQVGLSQDEILDGLCLAIYYAKKIELDKQYRESNLPPN